MAVKIVTFSLDPKVIAKLDELTGLMKLRSKSAILATLVEREHRRQIGLREELREQGESDGSQCSEVH